MTITAHYIRVGTRTVHYRHRGGGQPVVLLHASPRTSASLAVLMRAAPPGLSVFAPDTPGYGYSDPLPGDASSIEDFADALAETLTALGIARTRLYGTHTGADIALVFAVRHPARIVGLVLDGVSCFDADERTDLLAHYLPPFEPKSDGTHLAWLWSRLRDQALFFPWHRRAMATRLARPIPSAGALNDGAVDWLLASDPRAAYVASIETDSASWAARLAVPTVVGARDRDVLMPHLDRLGPLPGPVSVERFPAEAEAWSSLIWRALSAGERDNAAEAMAADHPLPATGIGDAIVGSPGRRVHWRGRHSGTHRPIVWIHASPGSSRALPARALTTPHDGPVLALDLPGHGESDAPADGGADEIADAVEEALGAIGLVEAGLAGLGCGAIVAAVLARRDPSRWRAVMAAAPRRSAPVPSFAAPRDDGGHLLAAWQSARDDAILGPWWSRDAGDLHDFGCALDWAAIHRAAVAQLVEHPLAARWREAIARSPRA